MVRLCSLWEKKNADGQVSLSGKMGDVWVNININRNKKAPNQPDYILSLSEVQEKPAEAPAKPVHNYAPNMARAQSHAEVLGFEEETGADFMIEIGKNKGKMASQAGTKSVKATLDFILKSSAEEGKEPQGKGADFVRKAKAFLGAS